MNLLADELITVACSGRPNRRVSLPELLDLCVRDEITDWPALRPHQYPAWHMFLAQLATLAHRSISSNTIDGAENWRQALRSLTPGFENDQPWRMVVDDWQKPAFLQPPCPKELKSDYTGEEQTPDDLDMLINSKKHDLKSNRMGLATEEQWLFSLISLQTMDGYSGGGKFGVARMNGGHKSRPMLRCHATNLGPGGQVIRDAGVLLRNWNKWYTQSPAGAETSLQPLLWLLPWDGKSSLAISAFHPLAIEVCRRIRLVEQNTMLFAKKAGSKVTRVNSKALKGNVGCPWAPIHKGESKSFSLGADGFGYRTIVRLLDPAEYLQPILSMPEVGEAEQSQHFFLIASGIARDEGKTHGVHQRRILLSPRTVSRLNLGASDGTSAFVQRAKSFQEMAGIAAGKILRPALIQRIQGKAEPSWQHPANGPRTSPWIRQFDAEVDQHFFQRLDTSFADKLDDDEAARDWSLFLADICKNVFEEACRALPAPSEARILAEALAWGRLRAGLWKFLPLTRPETKEVASENA